MPLPDPLPDQATPTVVQHPWRATARTTILAGIGLLPILPDIAQAAHIDTVPAVAAVLVVTAAVQRVLALSSVEKWMKLWAPHLSAEPRTPPKHRLK